MPSNIFSPPPPFSCVSSTRDLTSLSLNALKPYYCLHRVVKIKRDILKCPVHSKC